MRQKFNFRSVLFAFVFVLSACSCIYVNSQYDICPMGWGEKASMLEEEVEQDLEKDRSFFILPDLTTIEQGLKLLQRLTRQ